MAFRRTDTRPVATTERPLAEIDEFACLRVVSVGSMGAFLDWGLPKDLLLPFRSQLSRVRPEQRLVVRVVLDRVSGRPVATAKVERFFEAPPRTLREGQAVKLLIYEETELGSKAIVDDRFGGLLYREPGDRGVGIGWSGVGYVEQIRADGKIDLTRTPSGKAGVDAACEVVMRALREAGGRLELGDQSDPEEIRRVLGLSKKAFKRAVGALYRQRRLRIDETSIEWNESREDRSESRDKK